MIKTENGVEYAEIVISQPQRVIIEKLTKQEIKERLEAWKAQKQILKNNYDRELEFIQNNIDKLQKELNLFK